MTNPKLITMTNLSQLPDTWMRGIVALTFEAALAEYERKYCAAGRCWRYGHTYYFEAQP